MASTKKQEAAERKGRKARSGAAAAEERLDKLLERRVALQQELEQNTVDTIALRVNLDLAYKELPREYWAQRATEPLTHGLYSLLVNVQACYMTKGGVVETAYRMPERDDVLRYNRIKRLAARGFVQIHANNVIPTDEGRAKADEFVKQDTARIRAEKASKL